MRVIISVSAGGLKISKKDYGDLKAAIDKIIEAHPDAYGKYQDAGLSDMRFNWDVFRASKFDINRLYEYLDDTHINNALARILGNSGKDKQGKKR